MTFLRAVDISICHSAPRALSEPPAPQTRQWERSAIIYPAEDESAATTCSTECPHEFTQQRQKMSARREHDDKVLLRGGSATSAWFRGIAASQKATRQTNESGNAHAFGLSVRQRDLVLKGIWTARKRPSSSSSWQDPGRFLCLSRKMKSDLCAVFPPGVFCFAPLNWRLSDWLRSRLSQQKRLPRRRNQTSLTLRNPSAPALFLYLPNSPSEPPSWQNPEWFAGENKTKTRNWVRVVLDTEWLGLVVTLKPFNNLATPPVWNAASMCALWDQSGGQSGGRRQQQVQKRVNSPTLGRVPSPLPRWRTGRGVMATVRMHPWVCVWFSADSMRLVFWHSLCANHLWLQMCSCNRPKTKPCVCVCVLVCVWHWSFISYIDLHIIAHTAVEQRSRRPPLTWGPDMVF